MILATGCWPDCWKMHWIFGLYKKKSKSDPSNYRGLHLTAQLSKVVERVLAKLMTPYLTATGAFGPNQFAYCKGRGFQDALALYVLAWITAFHRGKCVALFCSDVAGAFDRVPIDRLCDKLAAKGVPRQLVNVIRSWLVGRRSVVVVDGAQSSLRDLRDTVCQGTVLGPMLWNIFFADARVAVNKHSFTEIVFADNLNCFRQFDQGAPDEVVMNELRECQRALHEWGSANSVTSSPLRKDFTFSTHSVILAANSVFSEYFSTRSSQWHGPRTRLPARRIGN